MAGPTAQFPENLQYTAEHEWIDIVDPQSPATVGITATAVEALGDIVYLELPEVGATIGAGTVVGEVESTKSVSELYSPVSGTVVEVNQAVIDDPAIVNSSPYTDGWLFRVTVEATGDLLSAEEYAAVTG
ncbi:glycine cleavage system protein GcvH [Cellulosimicrobium arenosum]|uniref:Glycine cleavage system H protein n=1 Tax=Cellulosimicrobium arenosum TaxID=2708133 RepID=A0A927J1H0_9MICO|nr:glycine cleavage system protein GcvH [Cellulosimicrobium arenosum]MBD8080055.1 glycine cleavage system protein GcvH [Cellulosimicrobium arenosum]